MLHVMFLQTTKPLRALYNFSSRTLLARRQLRRPKIYHTGKREAGSAHKVATGAPRQRCSCVKWRPAILTECLVFSSLTKNPSRRSYYSSREMQCYLICCRRFESGVHEVCLARVPRPDSLENSLTHSPSRSLPPTTRPGQAVTTHMRRLH